MVLISKFLISMEILISIKFIEAFHGPHLKLSGHVSFQYLECFVWMNKMLTLTSIAQDFLIETKVPNDYLSHLQLSYYGESHKQPSPHELYLLL
jgi:hypothetical protein